MPELRPGEPLKHILASAERELVDLAYRITGKLHDDMRTAADGSRYVVTAATSGDAEFAERFGSTKPAHAPSLPGGGAHGVHADVRPISDVNEVVALVYRRSAELGLHTPARRALESSLLIDEPFLHVALVSRQTSPEWLFGLREWAGYLDARTFARRHGDQELSVPFMVELHQRLSRFTKPDRGGVFTQRSRSAPQLYPLTDREIGLIEANPYLEFRPPGNGGPFLHGGIKYRISSPEEVRTELESLSAWYNTRHQSGVDPYRLASELQQRFVSIHPWDDDYNGRSSRLLMNWSLERDGLAPSAAADFNKDLFSTTEEWTDMVRAGSDAFGERAQRLERLGNAADPVAVFGLERERERYLALLGDDKTALLEPGAMHDITMARALLERFRGNAHYKLWV
ncbi:Fic family protein [Nocardia sp. NPDC049190]|uniref:Fic family protein n=1 Tax=Nocardia sp. NPDC049190 TaxID=3155650 RepID=UPI0033D953A5